MLDSLYITYPLLLLIVGLFYNKFNCLIKNFLVLLLVLFASFSSLYVYQKIGSTDFNNYYNDYYSVVENTESFASILRLYFSGLEPVLPLLYKILSIFPLLSPGELVFLFSFIIFGLFAWWLLIYGISYINKNNPGYILAISFGMVSMTLGSQLFRQGLSSVILLFCLSQNKRLVKIIILVLATLVHNTALPLFLIINYFTIIKSKLKLILILFSIILLYLFKYNILLFLSYYYDKISLENTLNFEISAVEIGTLKWVILWPLLF